MKHYFIGWLKAKVHSLMFQDRFVKTLINILMYDELIIYFTNWLIDILFINFKNSYCCQDVGKKYFSLLYIA